MILNNFTNDNITYIYIDGVCCFIGTGSSIFTFKLSKNNEEITIKINEEYIINYEYDYEREYIQIDFITDIFTGHFEEYSCCEFGGNDEKCGPFLSADSDSFCRNKYKILSVSIDNNGLLPLKCSNDEFEMIMKQRYNNAKKKL
jgi:hypothetical protein